MKALRAHVLDAYLDGKSLRGVDARIHVTGIRQEITEKQTFGENTGWDGRRRKRAKRELIRITIEFGLLEIHSVAAREAAIEAVNGWAGDGYLSISSKPGRRAHVTCQGRAAVKEPQNPKESFSIVFETAESPFWEDQQPASLSLSGLTGSGNFRIPGTADMNADVAVTPSGGTLNALTLSLGDSDMVFSGLSIPSGQTLLITHDENGYLRIRCGNESKLPCRTGESDDELNAGPGPVTASFTANTQCTVVFTARGRYR